MKHFFPFLSKTTAAFTAALSAATAYAAQYSGGGLNAGAGDAGAIVGSTDIRTTVINIVKEVLSYMALAAVVVIVIAGIIMVVSAGNEESKERAKRIILYTFAGLIIILLAQGLVQIMVNLS
ncbi:MAG TPA: hypothetical protein VJB10_00180 [Candidatus Peribacteraceae bacterium]|nr:hypothetical protein [Candidatus Peribacteraceae bacterium]